MDRRTALVALAAALAVPAAARSAWGTEPAEPAEPAEPVEPAEREPVPVTLETVPLVGKGIEPVRTITAATPFAMVGLTWSGARPDIIELRVRQGRGWSPWFSPHVVHSTSSDAADAAASEPVWTGLSWELEVRALRGGAPAAGVSTVLIDPGRSPFDLLPPLFKVPGAPPVSRAGWGADESVRCSEAAYDDEVRAVALHHTAGPNAYRPEDSPAIVRGIYAYHAWTLGWCDIGYHALVDQYGQVFEGRAGGLDRPVIGAHAGGFNRRTSSISMMGSYTGVPPSRAQRDALVAYLDWKLGVHGLDPHGQTTLRSRGGGTSRHPAGTTVTVPVIFGHRDVGRTECPGDDGYALLPDLRAAVASDPARFEPVIG